MFENLSLKYWITIILVTIITYGFLLTNQSIGVDDEAFDFYFKNHGMAMSGRYGYDLIMRIFNVYDYFPVWRDSIAIILLCMGAIIFVNILKRASSGNFSENAAIIFSSVVITYPLIAKMFVYISGNIEVALIIIISGLAINFSLEFFSTRKKKYLIYIIALLTFGISMLENCMNYYLTGMLICFYYMYVISDSVIERKKSNLCIMIRKIIFLLIIIIVCILLNSILKRVVAELLNIDLINYGNKYTSWGEDNGIIIFKLFINSIWGVFKYNFLNTVFFKTYVACVIIFLFMVVYDAVRLRSVKPLILFLCIVSSTISFYIITGNANIPTRIFVVYSIFCGFVLSSLYDRMNGKIKPSIIIVFVVMIVFYQSREVQQIWKDDFVRYQKDVNLASEINYEIEKECKGVPSVPVVFIGSPLAYVEFPNLEDDPNMRSIFSGNEHNASIRIHPFFNMLGHNYISPLINETSINPKNYLDMGTNDITCRAEKIAGDMPIWPEDGSITVRPDMVIVKLGDVQKQYIHEPENSFYQNLLSGYDMISASGDLYSVTIDESKKLYIKGYAYFDAISSRNSRIEIILNNGRHHYILATQQRMSFDSEKIADIDSCTGNLNEFSVNCDLSDIKKGNYQINILIHNGGYINVIQDLALSEVAI